MKLTSFFFLIIAFLYPNITQVQGTNAHNETYNSKTIKNSLYRNVEFLDTRPKNGSDNLKIDGKTF